MPSRSKDNADLTFVEESCGQAVTDGELFAELDLARTVFRQTMNKLLPCLVEPTYIFQEDAVKTIHVTTSLCLISIQRLFADANKPIIGYKKRIAIAKTHHRRNRMEFKDHWTLENALKVLQHPTIDAKLWAEAVEWLLLYGPLEIQTLLLHASGVATTQCFPELEATKYTEDGQPCYDVAAIAKTLGINQGTVSRHLVC